jgi:hypothetical protein
LVDESGEEFYAQLSDTYTVADAAMFDAWEAHYFRGKYVLDKPYVMLHTTCIPEQNMDDQTNEADELLLAQVTAVKTVLVGLLQTHPNKPLLHQVLTKLGDHMMGQLLNSPERVDRVAAEYQREMEELKKQCTAQPEPDSKS